MKTEDQNEQCADCGGDGCAACHERQLWAARKQRARAFIAAGRKKYQSWADVGYAYDRSDGQTS